MNGSSSHGDGSRSHGSIQLDSNVTEGIEGLLDGRIDSEDHPLSAMSTSPLFAVPPSGIH